MAANGNYRVCPASSNRLLLEYSWCLSRDVRSWRASFQNGGQLTEHACVLVFQLSTRNWQPNCTSCPDREVEIRAHVECRGQAQQIDVRPCCQHVLYALIRHTACRLWRVCLPNRISMAPNLVARQRREDATGFMVVRARFQECELRVGGCYGFTQDCIVLQCGGGEGGWVSTS